MYAFSGVAATNQFTDLVCVPINQIHTCMQDSFLYNKYRFSVPIEEISPKYRTFDGLGPQRKKDI